jgi:hypothetical protein
LTPVQNLHIDYFRWPSSVTQHHPLLSYSTNSCTSGSVAGLLLLIPIPPSKSFSSNQLFLQSPPPKVQGPAYTYLLPTSSPSCFSLAPFSFLSSCSFLSCLGWPLLAPSSLSPYLFSQASCSFCLIPRSSCSYAPFCSSAHFCSLSLLSYPF